MKTFKEACPNTYLEDRADWLIPKVGRTRDSHPLQQTRFWSAARALGGQSDTVEIHRQRHWAVGWIEFILVAPGSEAHKIAKERYSK